MAATATVSAWMSVNEAAAKLGVSPAVLRYQIIQGQIRSRLGDGGEQVCIAGAAAPVQRKPRWWKLTSMAGVAILVLGAVLAAGY